MVWLSSVSMTGAWGLMPLTRTEQMGISHTVSPSLRSPSTWPGVTGAPVVSSPLYTLSAMVSCGAVSMRHTSRSVRL